VVRGLWFHLHAKNANDANFRKLDNDLHTE